MKIRNATQDDVQAYHDIYHHYVASSVATLQLELPTLDESKRNFDALISLGLPFVVAVDPSNSDRVAGFAYADIFNERLGYQHTVEDSVYLHPDYCGKGLGKKLLQTVFTKLKSMGKKVVVAKMSILPNQPPENNASCKLHISLGHREVGRLLKVGYKLGTLVDVIILQLDLVDFSSAA